MDMLIKKFMQKNFAKRDLKEFNSFRAFFQRLVCSWVLGYYLKLRYKVEFQGLKKVQKNSKFIVASNHISNFDPFIVCDIMKNAPVAFMAKQELFEKFFSRLLMDWCGAFAVNRDKVEVATLRTALSLKNTKWNLGIFPQGTRQKPGTFININKGFATLAKSMKTDILPIAIIGSEQKPKWTIPFITKNKITVKIGDVIKYSDDVDGMVMQWQNAIRLLLEPDYVCV